MGGVSEFHLLGESVGVEPVQQLGAVRGDDLGLRKMNVRVDEAGHDQTWAVVVGRQARRQGRQKVRSLSSGGDDAFCAGDQPVLDIADGFLAILLRVSGKPQQPPAQRRVWERGVAVRHDPPFFVPRPAPPVWP